MRGQTSLLICSWQICWILTNFTIPTKFTRVYLSFIFPQHFSTGPFALPENQENLIREREGCRVKKWFGSNTEKKKVSSWYLSSLHALNDRMDGGESMAAGDAKSSLNSHPLLYGTPNASRTTLLTRGHQNVKAKCQSYEITRQHIVCIPPVLAPFAASLNRLLPEIRPGVVGHFLAGIPTTSACQTSSPTQKGRHRWNPEKSLM